MMNLFAQITTMPSSGASKAEDFQPPTRNPQSTQGGLQQVTGPQSTSGQDVLSQENTRIVIPVSDNQPTAQQPAATQASGGINWLVVIVSAVLIVAALEYFFRRREKIRRRSPKFVDASPQEVITLPVEEPAQKQEPTSKKSAPKKSPKVKQKSKSKSKRKKSRK